MFHDMYTKARTHARTHALIHTRTFSMLNEHEAVAERLWHASKKRRGMLWALPVAGTLALELPTR